MPHSFIRWIDDLDETYHALVGPKMARLGALRRLGLNIPAGFAITVDAFRRAVGDGRLAGEIDREIGVLANPDDLASVDAASKRIRCLIVNEPLDSAFEQHLHDAYEELCYREGEIDLPVAVRSSAAGEDAADASFAGQYESYLGVVGAANVAAAVHDAWASLFAARAISYRLRHKLHHRDTPMGVGVLRLMRARCAGVAFSVDPVSGKRDRVVIESTWGLGEALVQGIVKPDHLEIDKVEGRIIGRQIGDKHVATLFDHARGGVTERETPARFREAASLTDEMAQTIWRIVVDLEQCYGHAIDLEWVVEQRAYGGWVISVVQVRPVTSLADEPAAQPKWDSLGYATKYGLGIKQKA